MLLINNQKTDSAAARMAKLPVVRSAWSKLSVVYTDTKGCHPSLKIICEALENSVAILSTMATDKITLAIVKLEPQISIANHIACKGLDWLESAFPVLQSPTEEIVAIAKDKIHEAHEVVAVAAIGTMGCVQHSMEHVMSRVLQADNQSSQPVLERAINAASVGLDSALNISEALIDRVLPPTEEDKENEAHLAEEFESTTLRTYPIRLGSVTIKLCRRTYKAIETLSSSSDLVQDLQIYWSTFIWSLKDLPQYLQYQAVSMILFMSQMYTLSCPSQQTHSKATLISSATDSSVTRKDLLKVQLQVSPTWRFRMTKGTEHRCKSCEAYHD